MLTATGTGADRFYVMALEDFSEEYYCWYDGACNSAIKNYSTVTSKDFGTGKKNTATMIEKWNNSEYGEQNTGTYDDMLGVIQNKVKEGWFVPSNGEWSAFGYNLEKYQGLTKRYYYYSSYNESNNVWEYTYDDMDGGCGIDGTSFVRLSITF